MSSWSLRLTGEQWAAIFPPPFSGSKRNIMSKTYNVAVAGATGAVGIEMIETLEKRNFPVKNLRLLASERSVGKKLKFRGQDVMVELLTADSFKGMDFALFSA